ncbi:MAG: hypothetical protein Q9226_002770 [Calogaya cf. arnoldii]
MVRFIDVYDRLPASAPVGHPHTFEDFNEVTNKDNLRLADGICTMLYNWKPSVLKDFLDLRIPSIEIVRHEKVTFRRDMIIARHERACGFIKDGEFVDLQLDFGITEEGLWVPLSGFMDPIYPQGPNRKQVLDDFGGQFAAQIMYHKLWDESTAKEIKVDIEREHP